MFLSASTRGLSGTEAIKTEDSLEVNGWQVPLKQRGLRMEALGKLSKGDIVEANPGTRNLRDLSRWVVAIGGSWKLSEKISHFLRQTCEITSCLTDTCCLARRLN